MLVAQEVLCDCCNVRISKCISAPGTWAAGSGRGRGDLWCCWAAALTCGCQGSSAPLPLCSPAAMSSLGFGHSTTQTGGSLLRGFIALQAGEGERTVQGINSMAAHPTGLQHGQSQHRGLLPPHLQAWAQRAVPQPGMLRQGGTGAGYLPLCVLKRWADGFIHCCRQRKSVSTGGEGSSAGTRGVCPHVRAAWPWGRGLLSPLCPCGVPQALQLPAPPQEMPFPCPFTGFSNSQPGAFLRQF